MKRYLVFGLTGIAMIALLAFLGARLLIKKTGAPKLEAAPIVITDLGPPVWKVPDRSDESNSKPDMMEKTEVCKDDPEFIERRRDLGILVNRRSDYRRKIERFASVIDDFRQMKGLPFPFRVDLNQAADAGLLFSRCRSFCKPGINLVFVTKAPRNKTLEVALKGGKKKEISLVNGGIDALILDELNDQGVPFRSWVVPYTDGPWFIENQYLYLPLDISDLWLRMDPRGEWRVVKKSSDAIALSAVDKPLSVPGCTSEEHCFTAKGKQTRRFKSPRVCN